MGPQGLGLDITELRLGLPGVGGGGCCNERLIQKKKKRPVFFCGGGGEVDDVSGKNVNMNSTDLNLIVGWPPVCLYRGKKSSSSIDLNYVKVSMDGAPFLRKLDLSCFKGYLDLGMALDNLFNCYGSIGSELMKEESDSCEYVAIYQDKDGDWMLVGDVPWLMFIDTCKRLRIKRKSGANRLGLHDAAEDTLVN